MTVKITIDKRKYPDLSPATLPKDCYGREQFRYMDRVFERTYPGEYSDGEITVVANDREIDYWQATMPCLVRGMWYRFPEYAVDALINDERFPAQPRRGVAHSTAPHHRPIYTMTDYFDRRAPWEAEARPDDPGPSIFHLHMFRGMT